MKKIFITFFFTCLASGYAQDYFHKFEKAELVELIRKHMINWSKQKKEIDLKDEQFMLPVFRDFQKIGIFTKDQQYTRYAFRIVGLDTKTPDFYFRYLSPSIFEIRYTFDEKFKLKDIYFVKEESAQRIRFYSQSDAKFKRPTSLLRKIENKLCQAGTQDVIDVMEEFAYLWASNENFAYFPSGDMHYIPLYNRLKQRKIIPSSQKYNPKDFNKSYVFFSERRGKPKASIKIIDETFTYVFNIVGDKPYMVSRERVCRQ